MALLKLEVLIFIFGFLMVQVLAVYDGYLSCGISNYVMEPENSNRLLDGINAGKNFFPWIVGLEYEGGVNCTGTIISPRHILTAAHCIIYDQSVTDPLKYIRAGNTIIAEMQQFKFDFYTIHDYNKEELTNDIAIITLRENLNFSESISPICLPLHFKTFDEYIFGGFGVIYDGIKNGSFHEEGDFNQTYHIKVPTTRLHFGKLKTANSCDLEKEGNNSRPEMLCTFGTNGVTSADSGGPLMSFINGQWFLEGIASGTSEFLNRKPEIHFLSKSLFTKTSSYCAWIEEKTKNEALCQRHNFMHNNYGK